MSDLIYLELREAVHDDAASHTLLDHIKDHGVPAAYGRDLADLIYILQTKLDDERRHARNF